MSTKQQVAEAMRTLPLFALVLAGCTSTAGKCTLIGCQSGANVSLVLTPALASDLKAVIKACKADRCSTANIPLPNQVCQFQGPQQVDLCVIDSEQGSPLLRMMIVAATDVKDGDVYSVEVSDPTGGTMDSVMVKKSVTYQELQPNGPGCGPTCYQATLQK